MLVYSPFLKRQPLLGNLAVAVVAGSPPFYGALAVGAPAAGLTPWILAACCISRGDCQRRRRRDGRPRDTPADVADRGRSPPGAGGGRRCRSAVRPGESAVARNAGYGGAYFVIALVAQMAVLVAATWLLLGKVERVSALLKGAMSSD